MILNNCTQVAPSKRRCEEQPVFQRFASCQKWQSWLINRCYKNRPRFISPWFWFSCKIIVKGMLLLSLFCVFVFFTCRWRQWNDDFPNMVDAVPHKQYSCLFILSGKDNFLLKKDTGVLLYLIQHYRMKTDIILDYLWPNPTEIQLWYQNWNCINVYYGNKNIMVVIIKKHLQIVDELFCFTAYQPFSGHLTPN